MWPEGLVKLHNYSDLAIWGAYLAIPFVLVFYARKRENLPFKHMFWLFGLFIFSCGMTHFMEYYTFTEPIYRMSGLVKLITALASWGTVAALVPLTPLALAMKTPSELEAEISARTAELRKETEERRHAEQQVRELNDVLEGRVQERTADLIAANRELEGFCYSVSHDLRSPLRGMILAARTLKEDHAHELSPEAAQEVERLGTRALKMGVLIDDLLRFARLHKAEVEKETVRVDKLIKEIAVDLQPRYGNRVAVNLEEGIFVSADPELLRLALENLLDNAFKYSQGVKKPEVHVRSWTEEGMVAVVFRDNGVGFNGEYADKLFQPFQRLHQDSEFPGTGIGLANVRRIIERHGGRVWATSKPGEGSEFGFSLPTG
jgi:signal transduction histidine kinase